MLRFINENDTVKRLFTVLLNAAARNADPNAEYRRFNNMDTIKKTFKSAFEHQDEESVKPFWNFLHDIAPANNYKYTATYDYYLSWFKVIAADMNKVPDDDFDLYREFFWNFLDRPSYMSLTMLIQAHNGVESAEGIRTYLEQYAAHIGSIACFDTALYEYEKEFLSGLGFTVSEPKPIEYDDEEVTIEIENDEDEAADADSSEVIIDSENKGIVDEQEDVNMTEQDTEYMTVLEAAEQYVSELREAESSGQVEDAAALRRADNSFTITAEHAADLRNWFYRTFTEFRDCEVDTNLLVNLYKMRLRATECTLNFEQYLRSYAYDLLMFNAGIVDDTMPCYGDLKFINWLLTDDNAYPFIKMYVEAFNTAKVIRPVLSELMCIFRGEQSQEQVKQSEEDLLMQLNYDEYTMKLFNEARRKQLAS